MIKSKVSNENKYNWKKVMAIISGIFFLVFIIYQVCKGTKEWYDIFMDFFSLIGFSLSIYTLDLVSDVKRMTIDNIDKTISFRITMSSIDDYLNKFIKVNELARSASGDLTDTQIRELVDLCKECQVLCSLINIDKYDEFDRAKKEVRDAKISKVTIEAIYSSLFKVKIILKKYVEQKEVHEIKQSVKG